MKRWMAPVTAMAVALLVLAAGIALQTPSKQPGARAGTESGPEEGTADPDAGAALEAARFRALEEATAEGTAGVTGPVQHLVTPGWGQAQPFSTNRDEWEPAAAADPNAPYVYMLVTRYYGPDACGTCPVVKIMLRISADGGETFGPATYLCPCPGGRNQYDPLIEVADDGTVYAAWLQGYVPGVSMSKSADHGVTWTPPVSVDANWSDKPVLAVAPNGDDVYVAFNGPTAGDPYVAQSHDGGETWATERISQSTRYMFAGGGYADDSGLVAFAENDFNCCYTGIIRTFVLISHNFGATWERIEIDAGEKQPDCTSKYCYDGYYGSVPAIAGDGHNKLIFVYARANRRGGAQRIYVSRSLDNGNNWSLGSRVSAPDTLGVFPAATSPGPDEFVITFQDRRTGEFNTWERESTNAGGSFGPASRISNATSGASYLSPKGYPEAYGDYEEVVYTDDGRIFAVWGASPSYLGPGGIWYNLSA